MRELVEKILKGGKDCRVLVLGAGVTGSSITKLLIRRNGDVVVVDETVLPEDRRVDFKGAKLFENCTAQQLVELLKGEKFTCCFSSPGFSPRSAIVEAVSEAELPLITDLDLYIEIFGSPEIALTGTNGKTTVANLTAAMLNRSDIPSVALGNVGVAFPEVITDEVADAFLKGSSLRTAGLTVAELSSYQLELVKSVKPKVSIILNIDDDHFERHGSMAGYIAAKCRIFERQTASDGDWTILYADQSWSVDAIKACKANLLPLGLYNEELVKHTSFAAVVPERREILVSIRGRQLEFTTANSKLLGVHNMYNAAASAAAALLLGADVELVQKALSEFTPLVHRIEPVGTVRGVTYINDSKGTNPSAVEVAIDTVSFEFPEANLFLLLGGKSKEGSWDGVASRLGDRIAKTVYFGGDGEKVRAVVETSTKLPTAARDHFELVDTLDTAVKFAAANAKEGDVVLLSPGCASFDAFRGFGHRGDHFRELVKQL